MGKTVTSLDLRMSRMISQRLLLLIAAAGFGFLRAEDMSLRDEEKQEIRLREEEKQNKFVPQDHDVFMQVYQNSSDCQGAFGQSLLRGCTRTIPDNGFYEKFECHDKKDENGHVIKING